MDAYIREQWPKIRDLILGRWRHRISEEHLDKPLRYDDLCKIFRERCDLTRQEAKRETNHLLDATRFGPKY
jgi:hypothetical protein